MPTAEQHIRKYRDNKDCYSFAFNAGKRTLYDWKVTVLFYAALHLMEAVLAEKYDLHGSSHQNRHDMMRNHAETFPQKQQKTYMNLRSLSHKARYEMVPVTGAEVGVAQDALEELELEYRPYIERYQTPETAL